MPRHEPQASSAIRFCGRCGGLLTQSNKANPPRCYNTQACESRVRATQAQSPRPLPSKARNYKSEGLTFDKVVAALCKHFNYSAAQIDALLSKGASVEYGHAQYVLIYLLVNDTQMPYIKIQEKLNKERRTVSVAFVEVRDNPHVYSDDIEATRKHYDLAKAKQSA